MARDAAVLGLLLFNAPEKELLSSYAAIQAGLATGVLKPVVGQEMPLADAPLAHEAILRPGAHGNIILRIRD
jgi:NADPH2:quinone reductase